jgi:ATP-dependent Clp protease ATP-binding subunit ClpB
MNLNQFTVKAQEAVVDAQGTAVKRNHQSVEPEHLLAALLKQSESLVGQCLDKITRGTAKSLLTETEKELDRKPEVHGNVQPYLSSVLNKVLATSEDESKALHDDFISTEHLFLALLNLKEGWVAEALKHSASPIRTRRKSTTRSSVTPAT